MTNMIINDPARIDPAASYACFTLTRTHKTQFAILLGSAVLECMAQSSDPTYLGFSKIANG